MRRNAVLLVLLAACGNGSGGTSGPPAQQFGGVRGQVLEEDDAAMVGIAIALTRTGLPTRNATTDASGNFQLSNVETGTWTVTVTPATGFEAVSSLSATAQVAVNQIVVVPTFRLRRIPAPPPPPPPPPPPALATVEMLDNLFSPSSVTVAAGGTVRWTNNGDAVHNSTATGVWASPNLDPGGTFERVFPTAGTFNYVCTLHVGMTGTVVVQ